MNPRQFQIIVPAEAIEFLPPSPGAIPQYADPLPDEYDQVEESITYVITVRRNSVADIDLNYILTDFDRLTERHKKRKPWDVPEEPDHGLIIWTRIQEVDDEADDQ